MTERTHYPRAPITEAVIELRPTWEEEPRLEILAAIRERLKSSHPIHEKLFTSAIEIGPIMASQSISAKAEGRTVGYRLLTQDRLEIAQIRQDLFAYSRLAPYDTWERLRDCTLEAWSVFREYANPTKITRVGVRYINRIDIPLRADDRVELDDYFTVSPRTPLGLPSALMSYFVRLQIPLDLQNSFLSMTQTNAQAKPGFASVILDLDVFSDNVDLTEQGAWEHLELLRNRKNEAFEGSITDKSRELFR